VARPLHSFPTRRSSDLYNKELTQKFTGAPDVDRYPASCPGPSRARRRQCIDGHAAHHPDVRHPVFPDDPAANEASERASETGRRSEEHTSELQSRENLV